LLGETTEVPKLDDLATSTIDRRKLVQDLIEGEQIVIPWLRGTEAFLQQHSHPRTGALRRLVAPRMIDQDAPHHLGRHAIELQAILPRDAPLPDEAEIRFVDECGGLKRVILAFLPQVAGGLSPQLAVDERQEGVACLSVAPSPGPKEVAHLTGYGSLLHVLLGFRAKPGEPTL